MIRNSKIVRVLWLYRRSDTAVFPSNLCTTHTGGHYGWCAASDKTHQWALTKTVAIDRAINAECSQKRKSSK